MIHTSHACFEKKKKLAVSSYLLFYNEMICDPPACLMKNGSVISFDPTFAHFVLLFVLLRGVDSGLVIW